MVTGREIKWGVVLSRHQSKHTKLDFQAEKTFVQYIWCLYSYTIYMLSRHQTLQIKLDLQVENILGLSLVLNCNTKKEAALY